MTLSPENKSPVKSAGLPNASTMMGSRRITTQRSDSRNSVASSYDSANGGTFGSSYSNTDRMRKGLSEVYLLVKRMIDFLPSGFN